MPDHAGSTPQTQATRQPVRTSAAPAAQASGVVLDSPLIGVPSLPEQTPAAPETARRSLEGILERGRSLTGDGEQAEIGPEEPSSANGALLLQRKTTLLTPVATLKKQSSTFFDDKYDKLIDLVEAYLDDANAPPTNYGRRLRYTTLIKKRVDEWAADNGGLDKDTSGKLIKSKTDKRRPLVKELDTSIKLENTKLQADGLAQAKLAHKADRDKLKEFLDEGAKSTERQLKNTCEWFQVGKAKLYAVTPTGDSEHRIEVAGMNTARDEAWFPKGLKGSPGDILDAAVEYDSTKYTNDPNVNLDSDGKVTGGWNVPGVVVITKPAKASKETVWETLRHEVQHDADFNKGRDAGAAVHTAGEEFEATGAGYSYNATTKSNEVTGSTGQKTQGTAALKTQQAEIALTRYKTEYRAYSYQEGETAGPYSKLDHSVRNKPKDGELFTERQLKIFEHIYQGYDYTKSNWDANTPLTGGRTFRHEVAIYWNPDTEAFNKYNSPRVDDFYRALDEIGVKEAQNVLSRASGRDVAPVQSGKKVGDLNDPGVVKLLAAVEKLHGDDADYIFNESPAMLKKIGQHLKDPALSKVKDRLHELADDSKLTSILEWLDDLMK